MKAAGTLLILSLSLVAASAAHGDYQIIWSTIDGGGGLFLFKYRIQFF
jgi:hypothetical protein